MTEAETRFTLNPIDLDWEKRARADVEFAIEWAKAVDENSQKVEDQLSATQALLREAVEVLTPFAVRADFYEKLLNNVIEANNKRNVGLQIIVPPRDEANEQARALSDKIKKHLEDGDAAAEEGMKNDIV